MCYSVCPLYATKNSYSIIKRRRRIFILGEQASFFTRKWSDFFYKKMKRITSSKILYRIFENVGFRLPFVISSDRCSITYPWLVLLVLLFFLCRFNFSQERLGIIHCNFADMLSILLLNDSQSLNTFEILVWLILYRVVEKVWHLVYLLVECSKVNTF